MKRNCCDLREPKCGGLWKFVAFISFVGMAAASLYAFFTKLQNMKYRDKLIEVSERFPITPEQEAELEKIRKREWASANAPANRKTEEERLADIRITEEA